MSVIVFQANEGEVLVNPDQVVTVTPAPAINGEARSKIQFHGSCAHVFGSLGQVRNKLNGSVV